MSSFQYTALIRTHNSFPLVAEVVEKLRAQTFPPAMILAVDSASSAEQRLSLEKVFDQVIDYPNEPFNYSKAINIGVEACQTEYVLIISSHVVMQSEIMIQKALGVIKYEKTNCLGFCLCATTNPDKLWSEQKIDTQNFSPAIGLSNSCAFLKVKPILNRPFREDVFSAEDQEWASYYLRKHNAYFFGILSYHLKYINQHMNDLKKINEEISMAYFTHQQLRSPKNITLRVIRAALALVRNRPNRAKLHIILAKELFLSYFRKPVRKSSYYK
ncbi:MAG: glycosyltransferase [Methylotenera sp.]|uniref:glycosyltransferase family 2 protein n=1 Tax=Methylotenera sp. TaxID=2051956 RepID=UPI002489508B|nr:glycosyltransferase [Methylotenera sp.]MDI1309665.1 glycosyltransferase [Methylotenera sp.]